MRTRALLVLSVLTVTASACSTVETADPAASPQPAQQGAILPVEGHDWFYWPDGDEASLAYGVDETDNIWLSLSCLRGSGRLGLLRPAGDGDPEVIRLESAGEHQTYPAQSEPSELHDGVFLTSEALTSDPVFQRFRQVGWLAVRDPQTPVAMVPQERSAGRISSFFAFCG